MAEWATDLVRVSWLPFSRPCRAVSAASAAWWANSAAVLAYREASSAAFAAFSTSEALEPSSPAWSSSPSPVPSGAAASDSAGLLSVPSSPPWLPPSAPASLPFLSGATLALALDLAPPVGSSVSLGSSSLSLPPEGEPFGHLSSLMDRRCSMIFSYALFSSWKSSLSPPLSGWHCMATRRYARLISASVASEETPRMAYAESSCNLAISSTISLLKHICLRMYSSRARFISSSCSCGSCPASSSASFAVSCNSRTSAKSFRTKPLGGFCTGSNGPASPAKARTSSMATCSFR
mmetsp:Transcript_30015/g.82754  ORF Transcript_30015/g.82754 Transcript_30015/m.82754 type:complete len:293 (+) Transcript_30015:264-1142(+)